jgi:redox-sensitive bicupin YhaK (pirin superfamily)
VVEGAGRRVKVISGTYEGTEGAAGNLVRTTYLDVLLAGTEPFHHDLGPGERGFCYVHMGRAEVNGRMVDERELVEFASGGRVEVRGVDGAAGFLLLAARPNDEPIARGGPFVMNTEEEIRQAYIDYENGTLF